MNYLAAALDRTPRRFLALDSHGVRWVVVVEPERAKRFATADLARAALGEFRAAQGSTGPIGEWLVYEERGDGMYVEADG